MIIKVCGLKFEQNLVDLSSLDIDMVGYNFYEPSPRYVQNKLPNISLQIKKVGVFVNASESFILQKVKEYNLDYAQLHGDESLEFCKKIKDIISVIKVFRVTDQVDVELLQTFEFCDFFLFDTATKQYGGSGQKFDWSILNDLEIKVPFLLSGGIGPDDIEDILRISHPKFVGIDLNSKFEISPGLKDVDKVKFFVDEIKNHKAFEDLISPLGAGSNTENKFETLSTRDPQSLKGSHTLSVKTKSPFEDLFTPLGNGGITEVNFDNLSSIHTQSLNKSAESTRDPQSLKGSHTLSVKTKNPFEDVISPLGVDGNTENKFESLSTINSQSKFDMFYGASPFIFETAASLRRNMTIEESIIWDYLKTKPFNLKFRRQHPINTYIADFYCHSLRLVIEIDGINHSYNQEKDLMRDTFLSSLGIKTIRMKNDEVRLAYKNVIKTIDLTITSLKQK